MSTCSCSRIWRIASRSSRWRKPSAVGPKILQLARVPGSRARALEARAAARRATPWCAPVDRRSRRRPSFPSFGRRAVPAAPPGWAGSARARARPGSSWISSAVQEAPTSMACGLESLVGLAHGALKESGGIAAQIARLKGGVGHRRPARQPLDHGEQQIGVGVALRRVQHVVHVPAWPWRCAWRRRAAVLRMSRP